MYKFASVFSPSLAKYLSNKELFLNLRVIYGKYFAALQITPIVVMLNIEYKI